MYYLGIDVSKATLDVCLIDAQGVLMGEKQVENQIAGFKIIQGLLTERTSNEPVAICMEATGIYSDAAALYFYNAEYEVSIVNPARIKAYANSQLQRNKTDRVDARLIADFARTQAPRKWEPPSSVWTELRALVRHLGDLEQVKQQMLNRRNAATSATLLEYINGHIDYLDQQILSIREQIRIHLQADEELNRRQSLITSIPGIGELTAAKLLAEIRDITEFDNVRQLVAYAGLNPRQYRSGSTVFRRSRISKTGSASLRSCLYMPAITAKNYNPILKEFAARLEKQGLNGKEIIVAVMRKLLHLVYGILKSGQPFDPNYLKN